MLNQTFVQADGKDFGTMVMDQLPSYGDGGWCESCRWSL